MKKTESVIGLDLGGTKMTATRFNKNTFKIIESKTCPTNAKRGFKVVYKDLVALISDLKDNSVLSIGVGVPGLIRLPAGIIHKFPNIPGAEYFSLKKQLEKDLRLPVFIENDANCFALAEALRGAGKGKKIVVGITMGTGVGGGIVIDGKIFQGCKGFAGEIGHMLLLPGNPPFKTKDNRGDVEQFLSGTAMNKRAPKINDPKKLLDDRNLRQANIKEAAWLCSSLTHLLDPDVIVFGGSVGRALSKYLSEIKRELKKWLLPGTPVPELKKAKLKNAEVLGAALLFINPEP